MAGKAVRKFGTEKERADIGGFLVDTYKGVPARESRTGSWLVSPAIGREKNFGGPTILVKNRT